MPDDPRVLAPGHAPTPFTAAEIRAASRPGRTLRSLVETPDQPGHLRVNRYLACDEEGAELELTVLSLTGEQLQEPDRGRVTWLELQGHASFPEEATTVVPERITTALGELDCLRYAVRHEDDEDVFWFATALPGMPVRREHRVAGRLVQTAMLVLID